MSRHAQVIVLEPDVQQQLQREATAPGTPQGRALRLRIVLAAAAGKTNQADQPRVAGLRASGPPMAGAFRPNRLGRTPGPAPLRQTSPL